MKGLLHRNMLFILLYLFIVSCNNDCANSIKRVKILRNNYTLEFCDTFNLETRVFSAINKGTFISYLYETGDLYIDIVAGDITTDDEWGLYFDLSEGEEKIKEVVDGFRLNEFKYLKTFNFNQKFRSLAYIVHDTEDKNKESYRFVSTFKFDGYTMQITLISNIDKYSFNELDKTNRFFLKNMKIYRNSKEYFMNNKVWLEYFQENELASDSFINEMHKQLIYEFEKLMGKKLNWNKVWLFVEPIEGVLWYEKDSDNKLIGILDCFLAYGKYHIETQIIWYSDKSDKDITVSSDFKKGDLHFEIRKFLAEDWKIRHFPEYNYDIKKNQLSLDLNFPVYCVNKEAFVHEGYFIIKIDKEYLEKVKEYVNVFVSKWNRKNYDSDLMPANGFIHTIEFLKWEKNKKTAVFYIDSGSARTKWFYDFLNGLDSLNLKTKSVEILGAEEADYL